jgi:hypothetical protein
MISEATIIGCAACCFGSLLLCLAVLAVAVLASLGAAAWQAASFARAEHESDVYEALAWVCRHEHAYALPPALRWRLALKAAAGEPDSAPVAARRHAPWVISLLILLCPMPGQASQPSHAITVTTAGAATPPEVTATPPEVTANGKPCLSRRGSKHTSRILAGANQPSRRKDSDNPKPDRRAARGAVRRHGRQPSRHPEHGKSPRVATPAPEGVAQGTASRHASAAGLVANAISRLRVICEAEQQLGRRQWLQLPLEDRYAILGELDAAATLAGLPADQGVFHLAFGQVCLWFGRRMVTCTCPRGR